MILPEMKPIPGRRYLKAGYEVQTTLDGLGENDQMVQIWIDHIKDLFPKK